ncbi:sodium/bile acid cotransporter 7-like isoform X2 [Prorops nasuta]|uniref:sodium/bile acid cotransporter 7-like isoform X2 n=1 Tax=Prorops nasuta TaxID=863751 RepID=UPI0034CDE874
MIQSTKTMSIASHYGFFLLMVLCVIIASLAPKLGSSNGFIKSQFIIWYVAVPFTYFGAGISCSFKSLYSVLKNRQLLLFVIIFMYGLMPVLAKLAAYLLTYMKINIWLLKGMEVLFCMPPQFCTGFVLSQMTEADLPTSIVTFLVSYFVGLLLSPFLLYILIGPMPPLIGTNIIETIYSTIIPFIIGLLVQISISFDIMSLKLKTKWFSQGLLLFTAYHWFCDAITIDAFPLEAVDILFCILIGQILITYICWMLCSGWLPRNILLAALFTSTHKSVGLSGWAIRGTYHGYAHGPIIILPLLILPVTQLLLGSLLACFLAPIRSFSSSNVEKQNVSNNILTDLETVDCKS